MKKAAISVEKSKPRLLRVKSICTGKNLTRTLSKAKLLPAESDSWRKDLLKSRKALEPHVDKWL